MLNACLSGCFSGVISCAVLASCAAPSGSAAPVSATPVSAAPASAAPASAAPVSSSAASSPTLEAAGAASSGAASSSAASSSAASSGPLSLYDFTLPRLDGKPEKLDAYKGKVVLVVNTASECGYTPQYDGLEKLYEARKDQGFVILGFPSNDFGGQEPGDEAHIATFCRVKYGVTFPMFSKVKTTGPDATPLYAKLAAAAGAPKWNFHKYLVGKDGKLIQAFPSAVTPESDELGRAIDAALAKKASR